MLQLLLEENGLFDHKCDGYEGDEDDAICPSQMAALLNINLIAQVMILATILSPILYTQYLSCPVWWHVVLDRAWRRRNKCGSHESMAIYQQQEVVLPAHS